MTSHLPILLPILLHLSSLLSSNHNLLTTTTTIYTTSVVFMRCMKPFATARAEPRYS
jgi:hypothetical protein